METTVKLRVIMDVEYVTSVASAADTLRSKLEQGVNKAVGLGMLTEPGIPESAYTLAVAVVDDGLPESVQQFKQSVESNRELLKGLLDRYADVVKKEGSAPGFEAFLTEMVDDLASDLGARAANACGNDRDEQEDALSAAEQWVADEVGSDTENRFAAVLWLRGTYAGVMELIRWLN
jgi:hypothetical protein